MSRSYEIAEKVVKIKFKNKNGFLDFVRIEIHYHNGAITYSCAYIDSKKVFSLVPEKKIDKRILIINIMKDILEKF